MRDRDLGTLGVVSLVLPKLNTTLGKNLIETNWIRWINIKNQ